MSNKKIIVMALEYRKLKDEIRKLGKIKNGLVGHIRIWILLNKINR